MPDETRQPPATGGQPSSEADPSHPIWDTSLLEQLLTTLEALQADGVRLEADFDQQLGDQHDAFRRSARNLLHYLALRRHDVRQLQEQLATLGLSSLGRTESHVMAGIDAVLRALYALVGRPRQSLAPAAYTVDFAQGKALLRSHTEALLGPRPAKRTVRIMVTMPSEAAADYELIRQLLAHGMDCMRINCAHDDTTAWAAMIAHLRRAQQELGKPCRILMDVAGPKLRTGPIDARTQVVKWRPRRDLCGRLTAPAQIWLTAAEHPGEPPVPADGVLHLPAAWLAGAHTGDSITFTDARGKARRLELGRHLAHGHWATTTQTVYLRAGHQLSLTGVPRAAPHTRTTVTAQAMTGGPETHFMVLKPADTLLLTRAAVPGRPAEYDAHGTLLTPATIPCTLPEVFADVRPQDRIWFDDGKIGGVIDAVSADALRITITSANPNGDKLRADKGINLPDSTLRLPALTEKDIADLAFVVQHADLIGLSFVKRPDDVRALQAQLARLNAEHLGIVLKIETRAGFEHLPMLLLTAMHGQCVGVMIARGDLAVECGWERLAEVQEEILWVCEAAHVPVIWATQVLEGLAKKGVPSRAEITDAAMGERAECVMLNKGPHLITAVRVLDDILRRMEAHQSKKSARLRSLRLSTIARAS